MAGKRTQEWAKRARAHLLGSDGVVGGSAEVIFEKGKGIILTDVEGKQYIDICSFVQACNLGYGNKEIIGDYILDAGWGRFLTGLVSTPFVRGRGSARPTQSQSLEVHPMISPYLTLIILLK